MNSSKKSSFSISVKKSLAMLATSATLLSANTYADEPTLLSATQLKLDIYKVSTSFHQLTLHEGDTSIQSELEENISSLNESAENLGSQEAPESADNIQEVLAITKDYAHFATKNEIASEGFTSQYAVNDLHESRHNLLAALDQVITQQSEQVGNSEKNDFLKAAALLQMMTSQYVRRANSNGGAGLYVANEENLDTPDILADRFSELFNKLQAEHKSDNNLKADLKSISRKWLFVEPSFKNYNQDTVPYLLTKYCNTIVSKLKAAQDKI